MMVTLGFRLVMMMMEAVEEVEAEATGPEDFSFLDFLLFWAS